MFHLAFLVCLLFKSTLFNFCLCFTCLCSDTSGFKGNAVLWVADYNIFLTHLIRSFYPNDSKADLSERDGWASIFGIVWNNILKNYIPSFLWHDWECLWTVWLAGLKSKHVAEFHVQSNKSTLHIHSVYKEGQMATVVWLVEKK